MSKLLVVGGRQRQRALDLEEWQAYDQVRSLLVNTDSGDVDLLWTYCSPPETCAAERPAMVFKAGTLVGDRLWVCTMTEVLLWDWRRQQLDSSWSHPWFNDLHHVLPVGTDRFVVANTGLDQVLELSTTGDVVQQWNVGETPTWQRFDPARDYRRVATTKPHEVHANYLFRWNDQLWVTRYLTQDAICLADPAVSLPLQRGGPHDGVVCADSIFFTTVNGFVARCTPTQANVASAEARWCQLQAADDCPDALGWCRGIQVTDPREAWVGFSRLRPTRFRRHVSWLKHGLKRVGQHGTRPTRIVRYDLNSGRCLQEIPLESSGMNAVFGIYAVA